MNNGAGWGRGSYSSSQSWMRKVAAARQADLPRALRDLGWKLERDSWRGWRVPGHGGLIVWQRDDESYGWKQFSTGEGGNAISFLIHWEEMSRGKAVETLALYCSSRTSKPEFRSPKARGYLRKTKIPPTVWTKNASKLVQIAQRNLWDNSHLEVWEWLHARGLKDPTIQNARLGWIPKDYRGRRKVWDLPEKCTADEKRTKLFVPRGLMIPIFDSAGNVMRIWIRRFSERDSKYYVFPGSSMGTFILGEAGRSVVLCETDLDAWFLHQEAGDAITVAALGSSGTKPDARLATYLLTAPKILVSLDADQAGRRASTWWLDRFPRARLWPTPWSKDPGDAFGAAPGLVRSWIQAGLG